MTNLTRRSVLRNAAGLVAGSALARPHVVNAAPMTAEVWWNQGFVPEEEGSVIAMTVVADLRYGS